MISIIAFKFCLSLFLFWVFETRSYYVAMAASSSSLFFYFDLIIFRHKSVTRDHCLSYTITTVTKVIPNSLFSFSLLSIFTCFLSPSSRPWTLSKMLNRGWGSPFPGLPQLPKCWSCKSWLRFFSNFLAMKS